MTEREALKLALEALEVCEQSNYGRNWVWPDTAHPTAMSNVKEAITAIKEALAQPDVDRRSTESKETFDQQEPVWGGGPTNKDYEDAMRLRRLNELATPPKRTWVGLTEEDLKLLSAEWRIVYGAWMDDFARDIEAKLKEKNT